MNIVLAVTNDNSDDSSTRLIRFNIFNIMLAAPMLRQDISTHDNDYEDYRKTSSISCTKFQNLNVSCLLLQWSLPNPLKPGVNLRMEM